VFSAICSLPVVFPRHSPPPVLPERPSPRGHSPLVPAPTSRLLSLSHWPQPVAINGESKAHRGFYSPLSHLGPLFLNTALYQAAMGSFLVSYVICHLSLFAHLLSCTKLFSSLTRQASARSTCRGKGHLPPVTIRVP